MGSGGVCAVVNVIDVSRSGSARSRPGGVGDADRDAGDGGETGVLGHLAAPAPGDRGSHGPRKADDHGLQGSGNGARVVAAVPTIRREHTSAGEGGTHPSAKQLVLVNFGYLRIEDLIAQTPDMRRPATTGASHTLGAICTSPSLSATQIDMAVILTSHHHHQVPAKALQKNYQGTHPTNHLNRLCHLLRTGRHGQSAHAKGGHTRSRSARLAGAP